MLLALSVIAASSVSIMAQQQKVKRQLNRGLLTPKPTSVTSSISYSPQGPCPPIGDANGDGVIKPEDPQAILNYVAGIKPTVFHPERADVNKDGKIDAVDAALLKQYIAGIIKTFAACPKYTLEPQPQQIFSIIIPGSWGINALLKSNGSIVLNQSDFKFSWSLTTTGIISLQDSSFTSGCPYGINSPCPNLHADISSIKKGTVNIYVKAIQKSINTEVASTYFTVTVK